MKTNLFSLVFVAALVAAGSAQCGPIEVLLNDNFTTTADASNYTYYNAFNGPNPTIASFTTGGPGAQINSPGSETSYFLRNDLTFNQGETVTATFYLPAPPGGNNIVGLGFVGFSGGQPAKEALVGDVGNGNGVELEGAVGGNTALGPSFDPTSTDPAVLSITRGVGANGNVYSFSISGGGLANPITGQDTVGGVNDTISFGPGDYSGTGTFTNLELTMPVPEPSSVVALCGLCAMGLFLVARRRRTGKAS